MIPVHQEPRTLFASPPENCCFCAKPTRYWHRRSNQPVCALCARTRRVSELPPHPPLPEKAKPVNKMPARIDDLPNVKRALALSGSKVTDSFIPRRWRPALVRAEATLALLTDKEMRTLARGDDMEAQALVARVPSLAAIEQTLGDFYCERMR